MSGSPLVGVEENDGVVRLTLSHPPINALSPPFVAAIDAELQRLAQRDDLWVVLLRSDQRLFGGGGDLKFMLAATSAPSPGAVMRDYVREIQRVLRVLETVPAITVCELAGAAWGGGLEIALSCDFRVAAADVQLGLPEVGLGLLPAAGGTQRLTRLVGRAFSRQVILLNKALDAGEALRIGLVDAVAPPGECAAAAAAMASTLRSKPRAALVAAKLCIAKSLEPGDGGYEQEIRGVGELIETTETRQRIDGFIQSTGSRRKR